MGNRGETHARSSAQPAVREAVPKPEAAPSLDAVTLCAAHSPRRGAPVPFWGAPRAVEAPPRALSSTAGRPRERGAPSCKFVITR